MLGITSLKHTTSLKIITPNYNAQDYVVSSKWRNDNAYLRNQSHVVSTIYSEYVVNRKLIILLSKSFILESNIVYRKNCRCKERYPMKIKSFYRNKSWR